MPTRFATLLAPRLRRVLSLLVVFATTALAFGTSSVSPSSDAFRLFATPVFAQDDDWGGDDGGGVDLGGDAPYDGGTFIDPVPSPTADDEHPYDGGTFIDPVPNPMYEPEYRPVPVPVPYPWRPSRVRTGVYIPPRQARPTPAVSPRAERREPRSAAELNPRNPARRTSSASRSKSTPKRELRGEWVSTVGNLDYPSKPGLSEAELRREADVLLDRAVELGLNALFLQVRPMGDAFYPSKIYPYSSFVSGKQGVAPDGDFDVLAYWIEGAHKRKLQLHAWINPFRVTTGGAKREDLAPTNPAVLHPKWTFEFDGKIYLDPGIPEVRNLVVQGIAEIVEKYAVDGVHIDDYFYPARELEQDAETFKKYPRGFDNIEDWRRDNVNLLIQAAGQTVHKANKRAVWGVSPAGIWANKSSNPLGSETRGNQCYYNLFADVRTWVKSEWIDYVVPQIYWNRGFEIADFCALADWWSDCVSGTNVKLYVGLAAYRVDPNSKTEAWRTPDELIGQLDYLTLKDDVSGCVFFTSRKLLAGTPAGDALADYALEKRWLTTKARSEALRAKREAEKATD